MGLGFQASIQLFPWWTVDSPAFCFFFKLFVRDAIASRKLAKHVIVVKYLTLLEEASLSLVIIRPMEMCQRCHFHGSFSTWDNDTFDKIMIRYTHRSALDLKGSHKLERDICWSRLPSACAVHARQALSLASCLCYIRLCCAMSTKPNTCCGEG